MGRSDGMMAVSSRDTDMSEHARELSYLRFQMSELLRERYDLAAQLGASLYEETSHEDTFRKGREPLYDGLEAIDGRRRELAIEILRCEERNESELRTAGLEPLTCPRCGASVPRSNFCCSGCGMTVAEMIVSDADVSRDRQGESDTPSFEEPGMPKGEHTMAAAPPQVDKETNPEADDSAWVFADLAEFDTLQGGGSASSDWEAGALTLGRDDEPSPHEVEGQPPILGEEDSSATESSGETFVPAPDGIAVGESQQDSVPLHPMMGPEQGARLCPTCGRPAAEHDVFCMYCGARHEAGGPTHPRAQQAPVCPRCSTPCRPTDKFCKHCGQRLDA